MPSALLKDNSITASKNYLACLGDVIIKTCVQKRTPSVGFLYDGIDALPHCIKDPIKYQGADFFNAVWFSTVFGGYAALQLEFLTDKNKLTRPVSKLIHANHLHARSTIGLFALTGFEMGQSHFNHAPLDIQDIAAYGLGIAMFHYLPYIGKTLRGAAEFLFPTEEQKIRRLKL